MFLDSRKWETTRALGLPPGQATHENVGEYSYSMSACCVHSSRGLACNRADRTRCRLKVSHALHRGFVVIDVETVKMSREFHRGIITSAEVVISVAQIMNLAMSRSRSFLNYLIFGQTCLSLLLSCCCCSLWSVWHRGVQQFPVTWFFTRSLCVGSWATL